MDFCRLECFYCTINIVINWWDIWPAREIVPPVQNIFFIWGGMGGNKWIKLMLNEILESFVLSSGKKLFSLHKINSLIMSLESTDFYTLAQHFKQYVKIFNFEDKMFRFLSWFNFVDDKFFKILFKLYLGGKYPINR